jgi:hypothetical protein
MGFCGRPNPEDDRLFILIEDMTVGPCGGGRSALRKSRCLFSQAAAFLGQATQGRLCKAGYGALRCPILNEVSPWWEWLPATIPSRQDAAPTEKHTTSLEAQIQGAPVSQSLRRTVNTPQRLRNAAQRGSWVFYEVVPSDRGGIRSFNRRACRRRTRTLRIPWQFPAPARNRRTSASGRPRTGTWGTGAQGHRTKTRVPRNNDSRPCTGIRRSAYKLLRRNSNMIISAAAKSSRTLRAGDPPRRRHHRRDALRLIIRPYSPALCALPCHHFLHVLVRAGQQ